MRKENQNAKLIVSKILLVNKEDIDNKIYSKKCLKRLSNINNAMIIVKDDCVIYNNEETAIKEKKVKKNNQITISGKVNKQYGQKGKSKTGKKKK